MSDQQKIEISINTNGGAFTVAELASAVASRLRVVAVGPASLHEAGRGADEGATRWAKSSGYYGKVLAGGEIFNPYLCRRWLPAQYLRMMKVDDGNVTKSIREWYTVKYEIKWLRSECEKLDFLRSRDHVAHAERAGFLPLAHAGRILAEYARDLLAWIDYRYAQGDQLVYIPDTGKWYRKDGDGILELRAELKGVAVAEKMYASYGEVARSAGSLPLVNLSRCCHGKDAKTGNPLYFQTSRTFREDFQRAGAYYTLKYLVQMENFKLHTDTGVFSRADDALSFLGALRDNGTEAYKLHAILKRTLEGNGGKKLSV